MCFHNAHFMKLFRKSWFENNWSFQVNIYKRFYVYAKQEMQTNIFPWHHHHLIN